MTFLHRQTLVHAEVFIHRRFYTHKLWDVRCKISRCKMCRCKMWTCKISAPFLDFRRTLRLGALGKKEKLLQEGRGKWNDCFVVVKHSIWRVLTCIDVYLLCKFMVRSCCSEPRLMLDDTDGRSFVKIDSFCLTCLTDRPLLLSTRVTIQSEIQPTCSVAWSFQETVPLVEWNQGTFVNVATKQRSCGWQGQCFPVLLSCWTLMKNWVIPRNNVLHRLEWTLNR